MWRDSMGFYSISAGETYDMGRTDDNKKSIGKNADLEPGVPAILANLLYQFQPPLAVGRNYYPTLLQTADDHNRRTAQVRKKTNQS